MEQKNDKGYFSVEMGIYPRTLFIAKGKDKKNVIKENFTDRNGIKFQKYQISEW